MTKRVSVFGGSKPRPGESAYEEAQRLGRLLGRAGYSVLTGGYIGTMEAVSRGVSENGGHVIGVTCDEIERWRPTGPNAWVKEEIRSTKIQDRLFTLVERCDAAIALPGGIGTLTEISLMWTLMSINSIPQRPLVLVGRGWRDTFREMFKTQASYIPEGQRQALTCVDDVESAFAELQR